MKKLIIFIGPTAAKKTTLAHEVAKILNGAIINGDAFQIYKELNIGINKPNKEQRIEIPYFLLDIKSINENYSIFDFQKDFKNAYDEIVKSNRVPILCGGSHLYIDAILNGYNLTSDIQSEINNLTNWSIQDLENYVKLYDYETYTKIKNNKNRLLRAVAFLKTHNNQPKSIIEKKFNRPIYDPLIIMVHKPRSELYEIINNRVDKFLANNDWINEIQELTNKYGDELINFQCMKAIGYKQIYESIINHTDIDKELIKQKTRRLAKHQITWCNNKFNNKILFNYGVDDIKELITKISSYLYD